MRYISIAYSAGAPRWGSVSYENPRPVHVANVDTESRSSLSRAATKMSQTIAGGKDPQAYLFELVHN
jgi:hypothetical protein